MSIVDHVMLSTERVKGDMWKRNVSANLPYVKHTIADLKKDQKAVPCIIVAGGPTVKDISRQPKIPLLKSFKGTIIATDGILENCLTYGVKPHYVVCGDADPIIAKWFEKIHGPLPHLKAVTSITVDPSVRQHLDRLHCRIYWWSPWLPVHKLPKMESGGNVGTASWVFAMELLRRNPIGLLGFDFSYPKGTSEELVQYKLPKECYIDFVNAYTDPVYYTYRQVFIRLLSEAPTRSKPVYNLSENGILDGPGIIRMDLETWLKRFG